MSSTEIGIEQARKTLGDIVNRARIAGQTTYLTRNGRRVAAIVPLESAMPTITMTQQAAGIVAGALEELARTARRREVRQAALRVAELHRRTEQVGVDETHDEARQIHYEIMAEVERRNQLDDELHLIAELAESGAPLGQVIGIARNNFTGPIDGTPMMVEWLDTLAGKLAES